MFYKTSTVIQSTIDEQELERLENLGLNADEEDQKEELVDAYIDLSEVAAVHKTYMYLGTEEIEGFRIVFKSGSRLPFVGNIEEFADE